MSGQSSSTSRLNASITSQQDENPTIAPWIVVPPTPTPKSLGRTYGFPVKSSFSSLVSIRQNSAASSRSRRPSDPQNSFDAMHNTRHSVDDDESSRTLINSSDSSRTLINSSSSIASGGSSSRSKVSSLFSRLRKPSKPDLRGERESLEAEHPSLRPPVPELPDPHFLASTTSLPQALKKDKRSRKKSSTSSSKKMVSALNEAEHRYELDTDLGKMDGIVDFSFSQSPSGSIAGPSSFGTSAGFDPSHRSSDNGHSPHALHRYPSPPSSPPEFTDPFGSPSSAAVRRGKSKTDLTRAVSPTTVLPQTSQAAWASSTSGTDMESDMGASVSAGAGVGGLGSTNMTWEAPQSWAVAPKAGEEDLELSSSDESNVGLNGNSAPRLKGGGGGSEKPSPAPPHLIPGALVATSSSHSTLQSPDKKRKARSMKPSKPLKPYILRIYRENNSYHVVSIASNVTVAALTPALDKKLLLGDDKGIEHRLYLKERGRERLLGQNERPADIVRRRLEQAGYDAVDGLELLGGEGLSFLLKFVYKSQHLGQEEIKLDALTNIDLTGRGLRTIPVSLYSHTSTVMVLKLSRNPMLEIPLDFIQACVILYDLKMSNMSIKKVPSSLRHSSSLSRLDLSSNRISDLDDAFLDEIPRLSSLLIQNNKLERLPWYFPRMRNLNRLNISYNKFREFPAILTEVVTLVDLDISFNHITELPSSIGKLQKLKKLVMVGNLVTGFPGEFTQLLELEELYCQRNRISHLGVVCGLPNLRLFADHNLLTALELPAIPRNIEMSMSHNDITQISAVPTGSTNLSSGMARLDLSYAKLTSIDKQTLAQFSTLTMLILDHNALREMPDTLGNLARLELFSCSDNELEGLPSSIGNLQQLVVLDVHNNRIGELPRTLWNCGKLVKLNVTSNALENWLEPPPISEDGSDPPLVLSLRKLYLGDNRFTDDAIRPLRVFRHLSILSLSFNFIQDLPPAFFRQMSRLEELYLSGNKLTSIPTEDLPVLKSLTTLCLNGNKLQTLPRELSDMKSLTKVDVGSNQLKYNINNHEFDWNWNSNPELRYLNLSGNNRLRISPETNRNSLHRSSRDLPRSASSFTDLINLRVLGLIDVTVTATGRDTKEDIPDENDDRRIRTSLSTVNGMAYGIADLLGRCDYLTMLDLVQEFPQRTGEAIFAMFGRFHPPDKLPLGVSPNKMTKYLHDNFTKMFTQQLNALNVERGEGIPDAMRRTFLKLNQDLHDVMFSNNRKMSQASVSTGISGSILDSSILRSGASAVVLYFKGKTMYVANVGDSLAVVSRQGVANSVSRKHDPYDREEIVRIRSAEGWVSLSGLVNDEADVSRSFGFYHLLPIINAGPDIRVWELSDMDDFVIVANSGLWDYVSHQTAVNIVRSVPRPPDPMIAAQKLRDCAISYGADGSTMIMVIRVADLFGPPPAPDAFTEAGRSLVRSRGGHTVCNIGEVRPPVGHVAIAFTDIRNSTHLWEVNPSMPDAMRLHNSLLRRQLRLCGGYEVKTEGDAFMCSFTNALSAVWWCLSVQEKLLHEAWPEEILACEDGRPVYDSENRLIARGLSVRMGIHSGHPVCEPDPVTQRMDYFGPMVNRSARINGRAAGGQIMISADIEREINSKILGTELDADLSPQVREVIENIRQIGVVVMPVGEVKLKGLELPEILSAIYPKGLDGRHNLKDDPSELPGSGIPAREVVSDGVKSPAALPLKDPEGEVSPYDTASGSKQINVYEMRELGLLCLRLEALATNRVFRPVLNRKYSLASTVESDAGSQAPGTDSVDSDPFLLLPPMSDKSSEADLKVALDSLSVRIQNAVASITPLFSPAPPTVNKHVFLNALATQGGLDEKTFQYISSILSTL